jgi:hypothetical protein
MTRMEGKLDMIMSRLDGLVETIHGNGNSTKRVNDELKQDMEALVHGVYSNLSRDMKRNQNRIETSLKQLHRSSDNVRKRANASVCAVR